MVEDVLIKVVEFIFLVNFIILETELVMSLVNKIPVILVDHSLLPIMIALIVGMEKMKLTLRNMTMTLNVFNLQNQPMGFHDMEHFTLNCMGDFLSGGVKFDYE